MTPDKIKEMLVRHEGLVCHLYKCTADKNTIGVGRNLDVNGISEDEALYMLDNDIKRVQEELTKNWGCWRTLPEKARMVCIDMTFNLGIQGFMRFKRTRELMELGMFLKASEEVLDSKYAVQLPNRSLYNSRQLALCQIKPAKIT
jgi:lysozyme